MPSSTKDLLKMLWSHPANRHRRLKALGNAVVWQTYKRVSSSPHPIAVYGNLRFMAYPDSTQPGRFLYFGGYPDYEEMLFIRRYLRPGDGFIDGGANEGMYTLLAAHVVGSTGEVHAFEAVPVYIDRLQKNVRLNSLTNVTIHGTAIGAERGRTSFAIRGTGSRIKTADDRDVVIPVDVVTLDTALPHRAWAMAKLDVEGAEALTLSGAVNLLKTGRVPVWLLELREHFLARFDSSVEQIRDFLRSYNYEFMSYDPESNRLRTTRHSPETHDLLAVHREKLEIVNDRLRSTSALEL